jgi:hypothetical protein
LRLPLTFDPIQVPSPITTLLWMVVKAQWQHFGDFRQDEHMLRVDSSTFFIVTNIIKIKLDYFQIILILTTVFLQFEPLIRLLQLIFH